MTGRQLGMSAAGFNAGGMTWEQVYFEPVKDATHVKEDSWSQDARSDLNGVMSDYCVLLCSHNGASYIAEQLESIAAQTVPPGAVLLFDDQSSDATLEVALRYQGSLPLRCLSLVKTRGGAVGAFAALLQYARDMAPVFPYYFLCDQDDRWRPTKAERLLRLLAGSADTPTLVHSELLCFGDRNFAGRRFHNLHGHDHFESCAAAPLTTIAFENVVAGAACAFNRALLERAVPVAPIAFMHDWWLALVCVATRGNIRYTGDVLTEYRIHAASTLGRSGRLRSAVRQRIKSLGAGWRDPWLRTVLDQLGSLHSRGTDVSFDQLGPAYAAGRALAVSARFPVRFAAWTTLLTRRIWSVLAKDAYYKFRLFTDAVVPGHGSADDG